MKKSWSIWIVLLACTNVLSAQSNVALLHAPARPLPEEVVVADKLVSMPFELERGMIYVKAELDGRPGDFLLDTGAPGLVLNEHPIVASSTKYTAQSCARAVAIGGKQVKSFSWARRTLRNLEAITLDLSHLDRLRETDLTGMIGYELLKYHVLMLDYQRHQLLLLKNGADLAARRPPLARIPFTLDQHLPVIEVRAGDRVLRLGIDTGAARNLLDQRGAAAVAELLTTLPAEELQGLDQSIRRVKAVQAESLRCGDLTFATEFLLLDLAHLSPPDGPELHGLLGYKFLSNYQVAIDYPNGEILLWELP